MIVGLAGYAGSGKDTAAEALVGLGWERVAFADRIKAVAAAAFGWNGEKNEAGRRLLQDLGFAARLYLGSDVWVRAALEHAGPRPVVTDVRFPAEAKAIKDSGGIVVRIDRPGVGPVNDDHSEVALDGWSYDARIVNDSTVEELHDQIVNVLTRAILARPKEPAPMKYADTGSEHPVIPWLTEARRAWLYRVLTGIAPLCVIYGVVGDQAVVAWLGFAASVLGTGTAALNTSTKD